MKKLFLALMVFGLLAGPALAEEEKKDAEETQKVPQVARKVAMVNAAGLDEALFDRIVDYVEDNLRIGVRTLTPLQPYAFKTLDEDADYLTTFVPSPVYCLVGLVKMGEDEVRHGVVHPKEQVAVLNTTALQPEDADPEVYARRLEKESIRCVALLAGLPPCPSPRCALWHYTDNAGLDRKGRNLCPPCYKKYEALDLAGPCPPEAD